MRVAHIRVMASLHAWCEYERSSGVDAATADAARQLIMATPALHNGQLYVNLFCHCPAVAVAVAVADTARETAWTDRLRD